MKSSLPQIVATLAIAVAFVTIEPGHAFAQDSPQKKADFDEARAKQTAELQKFEEVKEALAKQQQMLAEQEKRIAEHQKLLSDKEKTLAEAAKQMADEQRARVQPSLENGTMKVFKLKYSQAHEAAKTAETLLGTATLRLAVDDRTNTLLVYGKPDVVSALEALLMRLDEQAAPAAAKESESGSSNTPRSLLLRVFWLADSVPETNGQNPSEYLPENVLKAVQKLGLEAPRLITQSVNAISTNREEPEEFSTYVPALLHEQAVAFNSHGNLRLVGDDRARVVMTAQVGGPGIECNLSGSLATPLGHYMVLGTASTLVSTAIPGMEGMGPADPIGAGAMPGAAPGAYGGPEGGFRGPGGRAPGDRGGPGMAQPGAGGGMAPAPFAGNRTPSRFAFVVQVVEGQSYSGDGSKRN